MARNASECNQLNSPPGQSPEAVSDRFTQTTKLSKILRRPQAPLPVRSNPLAVRAAGQSFPGSSPAGRRKMADSHRPFLLRPNPHSVLAFGEGYCTASFTIVHWPQKFFRGPEELSVASVSGPAGQPKRRNNKSKYTVCRRVRKSFFRIAVGRPGCGPLRPMLSAVRAEDRQRFGCGRPPPVSAKGTLTRTVQQAGAIRARAAPVRGQASGQPAGLALFAVEGQSSRIWATLLGRSRGLLGGGVHMTLGGAAVEGVRAINGEDEGRGTKP